MLLKKAFKRFITIMDSVTIFAKDNANLFPQSNYNDFNYANSSMTTSMPAPESPGCWKDVGCVLVVAAFVVIMVLGIAGNGLVIWIAGFKIKKTVNNIWYLSLALSDFLFCAFLPIHIVYVVKAEWIFGNFMCKFTFFLWFLNWFSSILVLIIISVDRCVMVIFPVWAHNMRTIRRALIIVLLAWITAALLSLPAAIFHDTDTFNKYHDIQFCYINYTSNEAYTAINTCLFIFGFIIPFLIIIICSLLITLKLKSNQMIRSNKPLKVMAALIVAFFIFWIPYHFFNILGVNQKYVSISSNGKKIGIILASTHSFMNPLLYAFMGKDLRRKCYAFLSTIESTFEEEDQRTHKGTNITNSGGRKL